MIAKSLYGNGAGIPRFIIVSDSLAIEILLQWNSNLVPRVFLRHTLITKPNEHPGTLR